jgi:hypothetical protein
MTSGTYGGGTFGWPWGGGVGLYFDNHGRAYPQLYGGTPGFGVSAGYTPDLEGFLTGTSISGSLGRGAGRFNTGTSGGTNGYGIGTPEIGVTQGFGPYDMSSEYSRPWAKPFLDESARGTGKPSRRNVWEYDYPAGGPPSVSADVSPKSTPPFEKGTTAVPYLAAPRTTTGGIPGMIAAVTGRDPADPESFAPPAGGLPGLIQDYLRSQSFDRTVRE